MADFPKVLIYAEKEKNIKCHEVEVEAGKEGRELEGDSNLPKGWMTREMEHTPVITSRAPENVIYAVI